MKWLLALDTILCCNTKFEASTSHLGSRHVHSATVAALCFECFRVHGLSQLVTGQGSMLHEPATDKQQPADQRDCHHEHELS